MCRGLLFYIVRTVLISISGWCCESLDESVEVRDEEAEDGVNLLGA